MIIARTRQELSQTLKSLSKKPGKLSLIPTMGNLHDGHLSLLKMAKLHSTKTIVTILCDKSDKYSSKMFNKLFLQEKGLPYPSWI